MLIKLFMLKDPIYLSTITPGTENVRKMKQLPVNFTNAYTCCMCANLQCTAAVLL